MVARFMRQGKGNARAASGRYLNSNRSKRSFEGMF